jgi:hypothetical protein
MISGDDTAQNRINDDKTSSNTVVVSPRPSPVTDHVIYKRIVNMFYRLVSQVLNKL